MARRLIEPLNKVSLERFREIAGIWASGRAEEPAVFSMVLDSVHGFQCVVVGGIAKMMHAMENIRIPGQLIAKLRDTGEFSEEFLGFLRPLRFTLDSFAVSEGEIVYPGSPVLQIYGRWVDCLLFADFAQSCVDGGTRAASLAYRCQSQADQMPLYLALGEGHDIEELIDAAKGCRISGWAGTLNEEAAQHSGLKFISPETGEDATGAISLSAEDSTRFLEEVGRGDRGHELFVAFREKAAFVNLVSAPRVSTAVVKGLLDPGAMYGDDDLIGWRDAIRPLSESAAPGELRFVRVLDEQGAALADHVFHASETLPNGARPLLERYSDRGRTCRPIPEPARSEVLLSRAEEELSEADPASYGVRWSSKAEAHA